MKKRTFFALLVFVSLVAMGIVDFAFHLLNQPNDVSVVVGFLILAILFVVYPSLIVKLSRRVK